jgi:hypothetical protein
VKQADIERAFIRIGIGSEKHSRVISEKEKRITAYHESGHAILFHLLPDVGPVHTISIIPTGHGAAGYTMPLPEKDEMFETKGKMRQSIIVLLGGRVAEELVIGDVTTGASQDIKQATATARAMVTKYGFSARLGLINYEQGEDEIFIGKDLAHTRQYGERVASIIDEEVKATEGSRVRLRLLDDIEVGDIPLKKGSYLYATMGGFSKQRAKGKVESIMVGDELFKVSLSIYDTDGLEGLYVPGSQFMETVRDAGSSAMQGNMNLNEGGGYGSNVEQWAMQGLQNAYRRTSNAVSKAIKKNRVRLKYGTQVYLVNGKDKKKK